MVQIDSWPFWIVDTRCHFHSFFSFISAKATLTLTSLNDLLVGSFWCFLSCLLIPSKFVLQPEIQGSKYGLCEDIHGWLRFSLVVNSAERICSYFPLVIWMSPDLSACPLRRKSFWMQHSDNILLMSLMNWSAVAFLCTLSNGCWPSCTIDEFYQIVWLLKRFLVASSLWSFLVVWTFWNKCLLMEYPSDFAF